MSNSDFASSALYNLAIQQLAKQGVEADRLNSFDGKTDAGRKSQMLGKALDTLGPGAIISIGQGIKGAPDEPTLAVLRRAHDPVDLIDRWIRLEEYYHGDHRVRLLSIEGRSVRIEHYAVKGPPPNAGEDLLIAGLLAALMQEIGCQGVSLGISSIHGSSIRNDLVQNCTLAKDPNCTVWDYEWRSIDNAPKLSAPTASSQRVSELVSDLINDDLGRGWQINMVAREIGLSKRSLQRALSSEGETFAKILRCVRTTAASMALLEREIGLAEIGYVCGFSDQAHFAREFKTRFNMTPKTYRSLANDS